MVGRNEWEECAWHSCSGSQWARDLRESFLSRGSLGLWEGGGAVAGFFPEQLRMGVVIIEEASFFFPMVGEKEQTRAQL